MVAHVDAITPGEATVCTPIPSLGTKVCEPRERFMYFVQIEIPVRLEHHSFQLWLSIGNQFRH